MCADRRPYVVGLACRRHLVHRLRDLGDALHSHAGVLARVAHRLRRPADFALADHRSRVTGFGLAIAIVSRWGAGSWLGGAIVGIGIAAMHYTGMAAFEVPGRVSWDALLGGSRSQSVQSLLPPPVRRASREACTDGRCSGALLLTGAICSLHFTAMGGGLGHSRPDD